MPNMIKKSWTVSGGESILLRFKSYAMVISFYYKIHFFTKLMNLVKNLLGSVLAILAASAITKDSAYIHYTVESS